LNVSAWSGSPALSAALVNALVGVYLTHEKNEKVDESNRVESYLENRIAQLQSQVDKSEEAVAAYRKEYGLFNGTNASVASQQLTELNTQLIDAQTAKAEADSKLSEALALRGQGARNSLSEVLNSPVVQVLDEQEATAEQRLAQLSQSYGPRHPKILDARAAVAKIQSKIALETDRVIDGLRNQARAADARYAALENNFSR
jgi:polysaccharide biosynthesis transport protein